jgi:hypothetical protein
MVQELVDGGDVGQSDAILLRGQRREDFLRRTLKRLRACMDSTRVGASKEGNQVKGKMRWVSSFLYHWLAVDKSVDQHQSTNLRTGPISRRTKSHLTRE